MILSGSSQQADRSRAVRVIVDPCVAGPTESDQVVELVGAALASAADVVYVDRPAASRVQDRLTSTAHVSREHVGADGRPGLVAGGLLRGDLSESGAPLESGGPPLDR